MGRSMNRQRRHQKCGSRQTTQTTNKKKVKIQKDTKRTNEDLMGHVRVEFLQQGQKICWPRKFRQSLQIILKNQHSFQVLQFIQFIIFCITYLVIILNILHMKPEPGTNSSHPHQETISSAMVISQSENSRK